MKITFTPGFEVGQPGFLEGIRAIRMASGLSLGLARDAMLNGTCDIPSDKLNAVKEALIQYATNFQYERSPCSGADRLRMVTARLADRAYHKIADGLEWLENWK